MPEYIVLYATTDCNHKCSHCFVEHRMNWDADDIANVASVLSKKCLVHINGAEPLLNPAYLKAYQAANQSFIFSNGLVFFNNSEADSLVEKLKEHGITEVRLSHHFNAIDDLQAVPGEIVETVTKYLLNHGLAVHYNTTVTKSNYKSISEICSRVRELGVSRIKFFPLKAIGRAKALPENYYLSENETRAFYTQLLEARNHYSVNELAIKVSGDLAGIAEKFRCTYGNHSYAITPDRKIYGCVYSISVLPPLGELQADGTILLYDSEPCNLKNCALSALYDEKRK